MKGLINNFSEIVVEKPSDKIITQIKELISSGQLKPGDKLPSERQLSERFAVGRTYVRDAIRKLEFYGILKTLPQSGTVVAGLGISALERLITDVLNLQGADFYSLVETRVLLETNSAKFAAARRTKDDIVALSKALDAYEKAVNAGKSAVEEDLIFHLTISEASKNSVLNSLMLIVTPDIVTYFKENDVCAFSEPSVVLQEHHLILEHIINKDVDQAEKTMRMHLSEILNFSNENLKPKMNGS